MNDRRVRQLLFELKDLRICYGRKMPSAAPTGEIKTVRIWMP